MRAGQSGMEEQAGHIWLRQSVTFSVNGQTRTVEMALPLRPGATPAEVEALLDEADAGMRRLSRRLDAHLASILAPGVLPTTSGIPDTPTAAPAAPASVERAPARPPAPSSAPGAPPVHPPAPPAAPMHATPDLTMPQFIAQTASMGLTPPQVMARLNVRSLSGLDLREALESLRRLALLEGAPAAPRPPLAFEEEESATDDALAAEPEMELSYLDSASLPDDEEDAGADMGASAGERAGEQAAPASAPAPDLGALRRDGRLTSAASLTPAARKPAPQGSTVAETPADQPAAAPAPVEESPADRAARKLVDLRAVHGGGTITPHRRQAFANIVTAELGEKGIDAIAKDVWGLTPAQLGPEHYDALIEWGKQDHFKDEAREVLKAARAAGPPAAHPSTPAPVESVEAEAPASPPARGGRAARTRPPAPDPAPDEERGGR